MIALISRQNLFNLRFKISTSLCKKTHVSSSSSSLWLLLHYFSTSVERQTATQRRVLELLLHKHNFSPELASRAASLLTRLRNPENSDSVLSFLKESGFSKTHMEKMVNGFPLLLSAEVEKTIKPKIKTFQDLGFSPNEVAKLISNNPPMLKLSMNNTIIPALALLRRHLGSDVEVVKYLKMSGGFLNPDLNKNLVPNFEFLKNRGVDKNRINWLLFKNPRIVLGKPDILKKLVEKVEEMGISTSSRMFIHCIRNASLSEKTWEQKVRIFKELGFSEYDITAAFRTVPFVFGYSEEKIKGTVEVVLATGKYKLSCIINYPTSFAYSIEKRYKPRLKVLEMLESKNMIRRWPKFSTLCTMTEKKFYEKFVGPYLDHVGDVYIAMKAIRRQAWFGFVATF